MCGRWLQRGGACVWTRRAGTDTGEIVGCDFIGLLQETRTRNKLFSSLRRYSSIARAISAALGARRSDANVRTMAATRGSVRTSTASAH